MFFNPRKRTDKKRKIKGMPKGHHVYKLNIGMFSKNNCFKRNMILFSGYFKLLEDCPTCLPRVEKEG